MKCFVRDPEVMASKLGQVELGCNVLLFKFNLNGKIAIHEDTNDIC